MDLPTKKAKKDSLALKFVKFQLLLKPQFNFEINFNLEKYIQGFFDKISETISNYKIIKHDEKRRIKLEKIENERKAKIALQKQKLEEEALKVKLKEQALKDLLDRRIWASTDWHDDEYCLKIFERYAERTNKPNEAKDRQMKAMNLSGNREEALMKIRAPTLVLHGSADTLVDPSGGQRTAEVIPKAEFVMIEGWGHDLPPGSWPKITNEIIKHVKNAEKIS